jgi:hydrogenase nickel insertion protein HypA
MHDLTYANKIIAILKDKFHRRDFQKQVVVNVSLGPFTHVTPESLRAAFDAVAEKENFNNVSLSVKNNKVSVKCKKCGNIIDSGEPVLACPACGHRGLDLINSEEFVVESVEIS